MRFLLVFAACALAATPARTDAPAKPEATPILVPYQLSKTHHILVRVKINDKGPFNFILDTGAPALFISKKAAEAAGIAADKGAWATIDRFDVEGGVLFRSAKGRVDDLFQLEGINGLGLAGVELHGVIGYNLLARYRIEYDFTRPKLAWTKLDFEPPAMGRLGGKSAPAGLDMLGGMMKVLGAMMGVQANFALRPRGFLGAELADTDGGPVVRTVLAEGPAAKAGLKPGDVIRRLGEKRIESTNDIRLRLAGLPEGESLKFTVRRAGSEEAITVQLGSGL